VIILSFSKQFPIRITLDKETCEFLIEALKANEEDFEGSIAEDAIALREKIERYGLKQLENGGDSVRLGFYENEGVKFIRQFLAASKIAAEYRELSAIADEAGSKY
jgi:hypothetical protein